MCREKLARAPFTLLCTDETMIRARISFVSKWQYLLGFVAIDGEWKSAAFSDWDDLKKIFIERTIGNKVDLYLLVSLCFPFLPPIVIMAESVNSSLQGQRTAEVLSKKWKFVKTVVETATGLKVLFISCDGAGLAAQKLCLVSEPGEEVFFVKIPSVDYCFYNDKDHEWFSLHIFPASNVLFLSFTHLLIHSLTLSFRFNGFLLYWKVLHGYNLRIPFHVGNKFKSAISGDKYKKQNRKKQR